MLRHRVHVLMLPGVLPGSTLTHLGLAAKLEGTGRRIHGQSPVEVVRHIWVVGLLKCLGVLEWVSDKYHALTRRLRLSVVVDGVFLDLRDRRE